MSEAVDRPAKRIARGEREGSPLKLHRGGGEPAGIGAEDGDPAGGGAAGGGGVVVRGPEDVARPLGAFEDRRGTGAAAADENLGPGGGAFGLEQNRKWGGVHAGEHSGRLPRRASLCDTEARACGREATGLPRGQIAQLVRAPRLHRGGRGFEPLFAHFSTIRRSQTSMFPAGTSVSGGDHGVSAPGGCRGAIPGGCLLRHFLRLWCAGISAALLALPQRDVHRFIEVMIPRHEGVSRGDFRTVPEPHGDHGRCLLAGKPSLLRLDPHRAWPRCR